MVPTDELEESTRRSRLHRSLTVGLPLIIIAGLVAYGLVRPAPDEGGSAALPVFELPLLREEGTFASEQLEGKPAVVNFWASWCGPCRAEAPLLEGAWKKYRDQGVQFLGVAVLDSRQGAEEFVAEEGLTYPNVLDLEQDLARDLDVYGLPQTYFVDAEGNLATRKTGDALGKRGEITVLGPITEDELTRQIEALLEERS